MYYERKNSPREDGYHHLGRNRAGTKLFFHIIYYHFQTRLSNHSFTVVPIHIDNVFKPMSYIQCVLVH